LFAQVGHRHDVDPPAVEHDPGSLSGPAEVARERQGKWNVRERFRRAPRLLAPEVAQPDVGVALNAPLGVPGGLAVSDEIQPHAVSRRSCA
jgi:hypothetical protein